LFYSINNYLHVEDNFFSHLFSIMVLAGLLAQVLSSSLQVVCLAGFLAEAQPNCPLLMFRSQELQFPHRYQILSSYPRQKSLLFQMASRLHQKHRRYCLMLIDVAVFCSVRTIFFHRNLFQGPAASVGLYIDCGSVYESPSSSGASHLLERMAFRSTTNRSHLRLVREVEAIGGNVSASASREQMSYTYDALKSYAPEMVEVLLDSVRNPAFLEWEVKEQVFGCFH
jgi:hypothetical protein